MADIEIPKSISIIPPADPRVAQWFLMDQIDDIVLILGIYAVFALEVGPQIMEKIKPKDVLPLVTIHNAFMTLLHFKLAFNILFQTYLTSSSRRYNIFCQNVSYHDQDRRNLSLIHDLFLLKLCQLLDTLYLTLQKRFENITNFHVTHRIVQTLGIWLLVFNGTAGQIMLMCLINAIGSTLVYLYKTVRIMPQIEQIERLRTLIVRNCRERLCIFLQLGAIISCVHLMIPLVWTRCSFPAWACVFGIFAHLALINYLWESSQNSRTIKPSINRLPVNYEDDVDKKLLDHQN